MVSSPELLEHVLREREHDRHPGRDGGRRAWQVDDEGAFGAQLARVDDAGDAARQQAPGSFGSPQPA